MLCMIGLRTGKMLLFMETKNHNQKHLAGGKMFQTQMQKQLYSVVLLESVKRHQLEWFANNLDLKFLKWMQVIVEVEWLFKQVFLLYQEINLLTIGQLQVKKSSNKIAEILIFKLLEDKTHKKVSSSWMKLMVLEVVREEGSQL